MLKIPFANSMRVLFMKTKTTELNQSAWIFLEPESQSLRSRTRRYSEWPRLSRIVLRAAHSAPSAVIAELKRSAKIMKKTSLLLLALLSLTGCAKGPLQSGQIELVILLDKPVARVGEAGNWNWTSYKKGRIEIYESWAVVIDEDGLKHVAPLDRFSVISYK